MLLLLIVTNRCFYPLTITMDEIVAVNVVLNVNVIVVWDVVDHLVLF